MIEDLQALFEKHDDEYGKFERVQNKLATRPDVHALILLDRLVPNEGAHLIDGYIFYALEHDTAWISIFYKDLAKVATESQVIELIRCGIVYDKDAETLSMHV